jgi:hypothetical protein
MDSKRYHPTVIDLIKRIRELPPDAIAFERKLHTDLDASGRGEHVYEIQLRVPFTFKRPPETDYNEISRWLDEISSK